MDLLSQLPHELLVQIARHLPLRETVDIVAIEDHPLRDAAREVGVHCFNLNHLP